MLNISIINKSEVSPSIEQPARILTPLENVTVFEHEEGIFECTISKPKANIQWTIEDEPIKSNNKYTIESNNGVLRLKIKDCEKKDEGSYQCKINDRKTNAQLFVKGKISVHTIFC